MKFISLNILAVVFSVFFFVSCQQEMTCEQVQACMIEKSTEGAKNTVRDGIFIHITANEKEPHRVLMPLKMANMMAKDKDVLVYMDIHAPELAVKSAKDLNYADFKSFKTYVKMLVDKKVTVMVCPTCLKIAGFAKEDLIDGVQIAQKDKFFNFTQGKVITLDY